MGDPALPLVSIVTPSFQQGRFLEKAVESVLAQDYPRIEHVVVDAGSTDETLQVLDRHPHLRWISEPDDGQAHAINKGFRMTSGEILTWLNADDYLLPGAVSAAVEALAATGAALVHGSWRQVDEDGRVLRDVQVFPFDLERMLDVANTVCQPGAFFTREAYCAVGGVDESYRYAMDYELWLKLGSRFLVTSVDRVQAAYRYHPTSKSVAEYARFEAETLHAARRHGARRFSTMYVDVYLRRRSPWRHALVRATQLVRSGDLAELARRLRTRPVDRG